MRRGRRSLLAALPIAAVVAAGLLAPRAFSYLGNLSGLAPSGPVRAPVHGSVVPCPGPDAITVLVIGQSNAGNHIPGRANAAAPFATMITDGGCRPLQDPVTGASGLDGSLWPPFADALHLATGQPVSVLSAAIGGTAVASWVPPFGHAVVGLGRRVAAARRLGQDIDLVIWVQGESDNLNETRAGTYAAQLTRVIAYVDRMTGGAPWLVTRTSLAMGRPASPEVRAGQDLVIARMVHVHAGTDTDRFDQVPGQRHDGVHFTRSAGDAVARDLARRAAAILQPDPAAPCADRAPGPSLQKCRP